MGNGSMGIGLWRADNSDRRVEGCFFLEGMITPFARLCQ